MINNQKIKIYFIGIGGIGMSRIAELMHEIGYTVLGSDKVESENVKRLKKIGIMVKIGHDKKNLRKVNAVVFSSAISPNNPEIQEAKKKHIPIVSRADMLSELMKNKKCIAVAGSHGKTTTTSLVGNILESGKLDPTIVNGGIINSLSKNKGSRLSICSLLLLLITISCSRRGSWRVCFSAYELIAILLN